MQAGHAPSAGPSKGRKQCSALCFIGSQSAALRDSRSSARRRGFICWKSSDLKTISISGFIFSRKV